MNKQIIIINGQGAAGKDSVCNIVKKYYQTESVSAVDKIKKIASYGGWNGQKDLKGRKLLSDIKKAFCEYNDLPFKEISHEIELFLESDDKQILFIHVREPEEIAKLVLAYPEIKTLLIKRNIGVNTFGNVSDDNVSNYQYDFVFENNGKIEELENDFMCFFKDIFNN